MATTKSRSRECREATSFSKPSCLMALSTASTWPWSREPFSTISKASPSETSFSPLRMRLMASTASMGNLDKLASRALADASTHPIGLPQQDRRLRVAIGDDVDMHAHYNSINNVNHMRTFYLLHAYILSSKISLPASLKTRNHWGFKQSVVLSTRELQPNGRRVGHCRGLRSRDRGRSQLRARIRPWQRRSAGGQISRGHKVRRAHGAAANIAAKTHGSRGRVDSPGSAIQLKRLIDVLCEAALHELIPN